LVYGELSFNPTTRQTLYGQKEIHITRTESIILHELLRNAGQVITHSQLGEAIWGGEYPDAVESIRVYIRRLREKIETDPNNPRMIITKGGIGYMLIKPD
jgi:two-component system, OmpR family, response regulator VicR